MRHHKILPKTNTIAKAKLSRYIAVHDFNFSIIAFDVVICLCVFLVGIKGIKNQDFFYKHVLPVGQRPELSQIYKLFVTGLLHADLPHLGLNLLVLCQIFFIAASHRGLLIASAVLVIGIILPNAIRWVIPFNPHYLCGASGGVAALLAFGLLIAPRSKIFLLPFSYHSLDQSVTLWIFTEVLLLFINRTKGDISHIAHVLGAATGVACVYGLGWG